jgi:hypothetical protein
VAGEHAWVGAALVSLTGQQASLADLRGFVHLPQRAKVHILETYCEACRRPWDDVADEPCIAATDSEHLRGGPIGERKNRTHTHDCQLWGCTGTGIPQSTLAKTAAAL